MLQHANEEISISPMVIMYERKNLCHKTTERLRLEGTSGALLAQTPAQAGPPRAGCAGPCPEGF